MVTPDYFKTFGIRLIKGRIFTEADNSTSLRVAVVNEQFVRDYMSGKDPIGQVLNIPQVIPGVQKFGPPQQWVIVGVVHDVRGGAFQQQFDEIDVSFYQLPWPGVNIALRTAGDPAAMTRTAAAAVHAVDPTLALDHAATLDQIRDEDLSGDRFGLLLYAAFAAIALLLATVGIYGVMAFAVGQRTHEIGVRMALGAGRGHVVTMVLREALILTCAGLSIGLGGAWLVERAMKSTLYGIGSIDFSALAAVSAILLAASFMASYIPARRASRVDPMRALRIE